MFRTNKQRRPLFLSLRACLFSTSWWWMPEYEALSLYVVYTAIQSGHSVRCRWSAMADVSRPQFFDEYGRLAKRGSSSGACGAFGWPSSLWSQGRLWSRSSLAFVLIRSVQPRSVGGQPGSELGNPGADHQKSPYNERVARAHLAERPDRLLAAWFRMVPNFEELEGMATLSIQREAGRLDWRLEHLLGGELDRLRWPELPEDVLLAEEDLEDEL